MSDELEMNDDDMQMPLGMGGESSQNSEVPFAEEKKPKVTSATLMLAGVFALGMAVIYLLGMQTKPRAASAAQSASVAEAETAITELLAKSGKADEMKNLFKDADKLVQMFYQLQQNPKANDDLPANPFAEIETRAVADTMLPATPGKSVDQEKLRKVADAFAALKLETVMWGKNHAAAMINKKIVQVGSKVGDFTVTQIDPNRVILSYGAAKFELTLQHKGLEEASGN